MTQLPLEGLRVLCLDEAHAGALTAMLLADLGADVVHAVPRPAAALPAGRATLTRGAQLLDLAGPDAPGRARKIADTADVIIGDGPAGLLERLTREPGRVRCTLPAFAVDDPRAPTDSCDEAAVAAAAGLFHDPDGGAPIPTVLPLASTFAAIAGAVAIAAALFERERTGHGQEIEVGQADAALLAIGANGLFVDGLEAGERPDDPWSGCFQTAEGRWVMVCLTAPRFQNRFIDVSGVTWWRERGYLDLTRNAPATQVRADHLADLSSLFASRDAKHWEALGATAGLPITMVRTRDEWLTESHPRAAGLIVEIDDPFAGPMLQSGPGVLVGDSGGALRPRQLVNDPRWPRAAWARAEPAAGEPTTPLAGLRVLDLTQVLAGPIVGRTLAEFGAEVLKVNDPNEQGPGWNWSEDRYHADVNRGKQTVLLDLKHPEGRAVLWRIGRDADLVVHNFRPGVAERLGVATDDVAKHCPRAIRAQVSAFGVGGPWYGRSGYESDAQAATGMAARDAGFGEPEFETLTINDYATGLLGALGAIVALLDRERTGRLRPVHAALSATASTLQIPLLERSGGPPAPSQATPSTESIRVALDQRLVAARGGWLLSFADAPPQQPLALSRDGAEQHLWDHHIAAVPVRSHREVMESDRALARGMSLTRADSMGRMVTTIGPVVRMSRSLICPGVPVSRPGHDAARVLREAGLENRLAELLESGVLGQA